MRRARLSQGRRFLDARWVQLAKLDCDVAGLYGPQFVDGTSGAHSSAFLAEESAVGVRTALRLGER